MPFETDILPQRSLAYFRMTGVVDVRECADTFRNYVAHRDFDPSHVMLTNSRALVRVDATVLKVIQELHNLHGAYTHFKHPVLSVLHVREDVSFGLARMLQQLSEPLTRIHYKICRTEHDALAAACQPERSFVAFERATGLRPYG